MLVVDLRGFPDSCLLAGQVPCFILNVSRLSKSSHQQEWFPMLVLRIKGDTIKQQSSCVWVSLSGVPGGNSDTGSPELKLKNTRAAEETRPSRALAVLTSRKRHNSDNRSQKMKSR